MRHATLTLIATAALLSGCATCKTPAQYATKVNINYKDVAAITKRTSFCISNINEATLPDGTLKVGAVGRSNAKRQTITVRYRARWYDQRDQLMDTAVSSWSTSSVDPRGSFDLSFVAPGPKATRYVIDIETQ